MISQKGRLSEGPLVRKYVRMTGQKARLSEGPLVPNSGIIFWDQLQHVYDSIRQAGYTNIILTGDFNADPNTASGT